MCCLSGKQNTIISNEEWRILQWHFANIEGPCGADLSLLSLATWDQDDAYEFEGDHCLIQQGYGHCINTLAQGLDIRLAHKVLHIAYQENGKVHVVTNKGVFEADIVLCTLPLGVLKADAVKFSPPLPIDKVTSINRLGFGLLNKLVLFFPKVFWDANADYIGYTSDNRGEFFLFINMYKVVGSPVLVAMIAGQAAYQIETLTGEEVVGKAMMLLHKIYGQTVADPVRAVVTRWASDPFACGSFSYVAVGGSGEDYDNVAKPVGDWLFFAGEATHRYHPSTVAGAYMSGLRAAHEIIKACSNRRSKDDPQSTFADHQLDLTLLTQLQENH